MTLNNEQLRLGIVEKLKEFNAYIDNELPDYIMVMLVNKKTFHQISNDLQLFLGHHTSTFIDWLQEAVTTGITGMENKNTSAADETGKDEGTESARVSESRGENAESEKDPTNEASARRSGNKRRKSEDELELHPTVADWEEEREGGGRREGSDRGGSRGSRSSLRRSSESKTVSRSSGGEPKVIRTSTGEKGREEEREGEGGGGRERGRRAGGRGSTGDDESEAAVKQTRPVKLSKSDDLRVLIARKKGERSAPPSYGASRRYSHSGSEGESGGEEEERERGGEGGRRGGVSSVVKVPERTHLSMEGGSRLLARAIKGLAAPAQSRQQERGRRGGREERDKREGVGVRGYKRKTRDTNATVSVQRVKRVAVEVAEEGEGERGEGNKEQEGDVLPISVKEESTAADKEEEEEEEEREKDNSTLDDTTRKVELAVITALRKVLPDQKELTDLRELINKQRQKTDNQQQQKETHFVVTMDGLDERYTVAEGGEGDGEGEGEGGNKTDGDAPTHGTGGSGGGGGTGGGGTGGGTSGGTGGGASGMPERCRFWPNCKKADSCPFHHPSAQCRTFPNCKYGNKCLFIHPQCKYDSRCSRSDCPYLHTAPRHILPRAAATPPAFAPPPSFPPPMMKFPPPVSAMWSPHTKSRYPSKSALTWTPSKTPPHVSQRKFAVPDEETTLMPVN